MMFAGVQAVTVAELYGQLDPETRDWTDGLLSSMFREINKPLTSGKVGTGYPRSGKTCMHKGSDCYLPRSSHVMMA